MFVSAPISLKFVFDSFIFFISFLAHLISFTAKFLVSNYHLGEVNIYSSSQSDDFAFALKR